MAEKKPIKKSASKLTVEDRIKAIEDRLVALESMTEKIIKAEKDLEYAGDTYDDLNSKVDSLEKSMIRVKVRMGI